MSTFAPMKRTPQNASSGVSARKPAPPLPWKRSAGKTSDYSWLRAVTHSTTMGPRSGLLPAAPQQPQLRVGDVNDAHEREADLIADRVMAMRPDSALPSSDGGRDSNQSTGSRAGVVCADAPTNTIQRACSHCATVQQDEEKIQRKEASEQMDSLVAPNSVREVLQSAGQPLDPSTRSFMEPRFNADFGHLRVHTGPLANNSARALNALAYTFGQNIVFRDGAHAPGTLVGKRLIAHELAHVIQQCGRGNARWPATIPDPMPVIRRAPVLTEDDAQNCTALYKQKLCVFDLGGCAASESRPAGIPDDAELARYNEECREESGYEGRDDVTLNDEECRQLESPVCSRGSKAEVRALRERERNERISRALDLAGKYIGGGAGAELSRLATDPVFIASVVVAVTVYAALWLVPEPVFSKLAAASVTLALLSTGLFSVSLIIELASAWSDLNDEAGRADTPEKIDAAAKHFGERIGGAGADLLVFLASLLVGGRLPVPKGAPAAGPALQAAEGTLRSAVPGAEVAAGAKVIPIRPARAPSAPPSGPVAFEGQLALKIYPDFVPEAPPVEAPPAAAAKPAPAAGAKPKPGASPKAVPFAPTAPSEKKNNCTNEPTSEPLPISWPSELPFPPATPRALVRTSTADREWEGIDRGAAQRKAAAEIKAARDANIPPQNPCFYEDAEPNTPFDAHHEHPLYLGGEDADYNLCALETLRHHQGHVRLDNQTAFATQYQSQGVCSGYLSKHPSGQQYEIIGSK